jgi:hypothetical protein
MRGKTCKTSKRYLFKHLNNLYFSGTHLKSQNGMQVGFVTMAVKGLSKVIEQDLIIGV